MINRPPPISNPTQTTRDQLSLIIIRGLAVFLEMTERSSQVYARLDCSKNPQATQKINLLLAEVAYRTPQP